MKDLSQIMRIAGLLIAFLTLFCFPVLAQPGKDKMSSVAVEELLPIPRANWGELDGDKMIPARGGSVDWGLALSGGGIRAGSYSIGVMKALYDAGFFKHLDAISSVSGGGYASYWLFGQTDLNGNREFGDSVFADDIFFQRTCDLQRDSQMFGLRSMLPTLFMSKEKAFTEYQMAIHRTFGRNSNDLLLRPIGVYSNDIRDRRMPYLFVNATLDAKIINAGTTDVQKIKDAYRSVEISPIHIGNPGVGYSRWPEASPRAMNFSKSIAVAGAGVKFKIKKGVTNFAPESFRTEKELYLYDGGKSENLAALALIRRHIKNVIIVDAGHDPRYEYGDYLTLQRLLRQYNITLCVPEIDKCSGIAEPSDTIKKDGLMEGYASDITTGDRISTIYFVKLSRPTDIFPSDHQTEISGIKKAGERIALIQKWYPQGYASLRKRDGQIDKVNNVTLPPSQCQARTGSVDPEMYRYLANSYGYYLDKTKWKWAGKLNSFLAYEFPHTTTVDQSYFPDQMEAFIGLGFLQGHALAAELKAKYGW